jgi:hypothetical protein
MKTIGITIALALAIFGIGTAIELAPRNTDSVPSACTIVISPVSAACMEHGNVCKYEDGNPDGKPCWWFNEGNVWYNDGSEYRNTNE